MIGLTRVLDTLFLITLGHQQNALDQGQGFYLVEPTDADPGYFHIVENWDGQWYRTIAEDGYPSELPRDESGTVEQNPWAFYPALPYLARAVMALSGVSFGAAASTISLLASSAALLLLYRLIATRGGRVVALLSITAVSACPAGAILQTAYTEGLSLLLIVLGISAVIGRRYRWFVVVALLLAFTRPVVLALVPVLAVHGYLRWRREPDFGLRRATPLVAAGCVAVLSFGLWPLTAALVTGEADAYLATQQAWILDASGWTTWGDQLLGALGAHEAAQVAAVVFLGVAIMVQPAARLWPSELRAWVLSYGAYLLATVRTTPSITRYAVLLLVVWWPFPSLGRRMPRLAQAALLLALIVVGSLLQYAWLQDAFVLSDVRVSYP